MMRRFEAETEDLARLLADLPSGVVAVAARTERGVEVMVASSFIGGISDDPPLALFSVRRESRTWPVLAAAPVLGVSVLGQRNESAVRQLASRDRTRRLDGVDYWAARSGAVFLEGAPHWLECVREQEHAVGDHELVVLRVLAVMHDASEPPLIRHRRELRALAG